MILPSILYHEIQLDIIYLFTGYEDDSKLIVSRKTATISQSKADRGK